MARSAGREMLIPWYCYAVVFTDDVWYGKSLVCRLFFGVGRGDFFCELHLPDSKALLVLLRSTFCSISTLPSTSRSTLTS